MKWSTSLLKRVALAAGIKQRRAGRKERLPSLCGRAWAMQSRILFSPDGMRDQASWAVLPPLKLPAVDTYAPLHIWPLVSLLLHFRFPWKTESKLFCPVLKRRDNAVPADVRLLYVNRENWLDPQSLVWVRMHKYTQTHVNPFAIPEQSLPPKVHSGDDTGNAV